MSIQSLKSLVELQGLQSIASSDVASTENSEFTQLLNEVLTGSTSFGQIENQLGGIQSLITSNQLATSNSLGSSYVNSLLLSPTAAVMQNKLPSTTVPATAATIEQYKTPDFTGQKAFEGVLAGANQYASLIEKAAKKYDLPEKLIASVMKQESNFRSDAVSYAGATGLMQLMPATARFLGVNDSTNPEQNVMGGAKYLRQMLNQFDNNISTALAAYNAGPGNVNKYNGIPPFKETQNYVKNVLNYYQT